MCRTGFCGVEGVAVAIVSSGNYIAGALWPPLVQEIVQAYSWRTAYVVIGSVCVLTMIPLALLLQEKATSDNG